MRRFVQTPSCNMAGRPACMLRGSSFCSPVLTLSLGTGYRPSAFFFYAPLSLTSRLERHFFNNACFHCRFHFLPHRWHRSIYRSTFHEVHLFLLHFRRPSRSYFADLNTLPARLARQTRLLATNWSRRANKPRARCPQAQAVAACDTSRQFGLKELLR